MSAEVSFTKRAAAELSRCFNGLTVSRSGSKKSTSGPTASSSASGTNNCSAKDKEKQLPSTETTFLLAKNSSKGPGRGSDEIISGQTLITKANTTISPLKARNGHPVAQCSASKPGTPSHRPPVPRKTSIVRRINFISRLTKPRTLKDLWMDQPFLSTFFHFFTSKDRTVLSQVCSQWRDVLYDEPSYWIGLMPVIYCNELRRIGQEEEASGDQQETSSTTDLERDIVKSKLYSSLDIRHFECLCLFGATDEDVLDIASHMSPSALGRIVNGSLRCGSVTDKGLEVFLVALNQSLVKLEISGKCCNEVSDSGLWTSIVPRLQSLAIQDCINVADETLGAITQMLPLLKELNLQAYHVTDPAMAYFGSSSAKENLKYLHVHHCWELSNQGIVNIAHGLPNLETLSLAGCSKVSDDAVEVIAEQLRRLKKLDLSWCARISDAALEYVACDMSDTLEELVLDRCVHLSDIGLGYLATMTKLSTLSLRYCPQVRDFGLQTLCSIKSLRSLSVAGCPQLTVSGLSCLVQMQQLTEIELTNCPGASKELHKYLVDHLPSSCLLIV
ncbi:F-box/LRR-repeat protein 16 [Halotydeus destructor]|nr:F-box/LRR-repeat protein 16 [Halotydeus destructor]